MGTLYEDINDALRTLYRETYSPTIQTDTSSGFWIRKECDDIMIKNGRSMRTSYYGKVTHILFESKECALLTHMHVNFMDNECIKVKEEFILVIFPQYLIVQKYYWFIEHEPIQILLRNKRCTVFSDSNDVMTYLKPDHIKYTDWIFNIISRLRTYKNEKKIPLFSDVLWMYKTKERQLFDAEFVHVEIHSATQDGDLLFCEQNEWKIIGSKSFTSV